MDLMDTPLGDEVTRIIAANKGSPNVYIDAVIHTNYGDIPALRILNYDIIREYSQQFGDEISLTVTVPAGKHAFRIIPSRNDLEITIKGATVNSYGPTAADEHPLGFQRYRAILKVAADETMQANSKESLDEETMDRSDFATIEFQLISKAMEQFSMRSCGGIYRRTTVGSVIRSLLLSQGSALTMDDGYQPKGIDMVEPKDAVLREHIVLPHGLPVSDAPGYIHRYCGGVYSAGLSYYYQDDYWYIYPTYDYKRFAEATRQLVIINIPKHKLPGLDCTYLQEGSLVTVLATGDLTFDDMSDKQKRATGNGVRFADASKLFADGAQVGGNKAMASRGKQNSEFVSTPQKAALNNVQVSDERITANVLFQASQLASKEGVHIQLAWENSDPSLIRPGMQTKIMYYKNGVVKQVYAVVVAVQVSTQYQGLGQVTGRYNRISAIYLFAANDVNQPDAT